MLYKLVGVKRNLKILEKRSYNYPVIISVIKSLESAIEEVTRPGK